MFGKVNEIGIIVEDAQFCALTGARIRHSTIIQLSGRAFVRVNLSAWGKLSDDEKTAAINRWDAEANPPAPEVEKRSKKVAE